MRAMNLKFLLTALIAVTFFSSVVRGDEMSGTVVAVTPQAITVQKGTEAWIIKRTTTTKVTGELKVGSTISIQYNAPDAQKKEDPISIGTPTPSAE